MVAEKIAALLTGNDGLSLTFYESIVSYGPAGERAFHGIEGVATEGGKLRANFR